jgi:hypothetical protein
MYFIRLCRPCQGFFHLLDRLLFCYSFTTENPTIGLFISDEISLDSLGFLQYDVAEIDL